MKTLRLFSAAAFAALALSACASTPGPVEVTRFVEPTASAQLGRGTVFIEAAPGFGDDSLRLAPYKSAVAAELKRLGYTESDRASATQIAQIRLERYGFDGGTQRNPVSVGVGGSTGSYGSGVGLGIGINLGGGAKRQIGTDMGVVIRDAATEKSLWEGRASFRAAENSPLAQSAASAQTVASALFRDFPGNNGETIQVKVPK